MTNTIELIENKFSASNADTIEKHYDGHALKIIVDLGNDVSATVGFSGPTPDYAPEDAYKLVVETAHLIDAAPTLLEELEWALDVIKYNNLKVDTSRADFAVSKARGE